MDGRALDDSLETGGRLGVDHAFDHELVSSWSRKSFRLARSRSTSTARLEHGGGVLVVGQRHQQVSVAYSCCRALARASARRRVFSRLRDNMGIRAVRQSFSIVHCKGCWCWRAKSITWVTFVSAIS